MYLLLVSNILAQERVLVITNLETHKEKSFKENSRIKIKTLSGGKLVGRLQIIDENSIRLRGVTVSLSDIEKVKKHPLIASIGHSVGMTALGVGTVAVGALLSDPFIGGSSDAPKYIGIVLGIGAIYGATQPINLFDKGYSINKKWRFSIIHTTDANPIKKE